MFKTYSYIYIKLRHRKKQMCVSMLKKTPLEVFLSEVCAPEAMPSSASEVKSMLWVWYTVSPYNEWEWEASLDWSSLLFIYFSFHLCNVFAIAVQLKGTDCWHLHSNAYLLPYLTFCSFKIPNNTVNSTKCNYIWNFH